MQRVKAFIAALLSLSAFTRPSDDPSLGDPEVERRLAQMGGQVQPLISSQTRWYIADVETATLAADGGWMALAARLWRAAKSDGTFRGVLSTRSGGLVRLPKKFVGRADIVEALEAGFELARSVFDEMFPAAELALLAEDGIGLGVGVGILIPVEGRDHPVFRRLDPEFLVYRWIEDRWYYRSNAGLLPITPGDGRWVLHIPGGRMAPWQHGLWRAIGYSWIRKTNAKLYKDSWEGKLANPARVVKVPAGADEKHKTSFWKKLADWGVNTVFALLPGYEISILETNGKGADSFNKTIADENQEMVIAVAGQTVTTTGGTGFANADIHKSIRADLIKETADGLAHTINTQGLPTWILRVFGEQALVDGCVVEWDVTPPKDAAASANVLTAAAGAITALRAALAADGKAPDVEAICRQFGIRVVDLPSTTEPAANDEPGEQSNVVPIRRATGARAA